jgi:hypothetical protein
VNTSEFIQKARQIWPEYIFDKTEYIHPKTNDELLSPQA